MSLRLMIAALLALGVLPGCASVDDNPISLVAQKPVLNRWPFKRPPASPKTERANDAPRIYDGPDDSLAGPEGRLPGAAAQPQPGNEDFLRALPADLSDQIESELVGATPEERKRLLAYLATVERARIPSLLEARRKQRSAPAGSEPPEVVTADAVGRPAFDRETEATPDRQVQQAAAETPPQALPAAPLPRPRRNPLIEIQGVEFEDEPTDELPQVTPATSMNPGEQFEPAIEPAVVPPPTPPGPPASAAPTTNPLTKLKEWTTIRKPDPVSSSNEAPLPTTPSPADPSALSLQGLSRRLRGGAAARIETASLPVDPLPTAGESPHLHEGLQRLIALMEAETARLKPGTSFAEREEYVRRHAELRMLYLMSRQPTLALQAIPEADAETQEFWTSLMWSMSNYFDNESIADPGERAAATLNRLRAAEHHLQTTARLEINSLAFCDKIDGFGSYHPFEQDLFQAGQPVLLYAEVRNFKTDVTAAGRYRTSLKSTIEIIKSGADGELIERRHFDSTEDQSRSLRSDYFHSYKLDLPLHLTPGSYTLRLTLEDDLSGKIGNASIDFLVR